MRPAAPQFRTTDRLIAIGSSAGGTEALRVVLEGMPADAPAVVMTQHLPASFSSAFAERLDRHSAMAVREASDGEAVLPGHAYLPPGGKHLRIIRDGARWRCRVDDGPAVNRHKPAVDVLFRSVAQSAGGNAIGAILTGMGDDGARGLLECARPARRRWSRMKPPAWSGACPALPSNWERPKNRCHWNGSPNDCWRSPAADRPRHRTA